MLYASKGCIKFYMNGSLKHFAQSMTSVKSQQQL